MAMFKVGQRVRVVCIDMQIPGPHLVIPFVGAEGDIVKIMPEPDCPVPYVVLFKEGPLNSDTKTPQWCFAACELSPLTDPQADTFIERIKRLEREPAPFIKERV